MGLRTTAFDRATSLGWDIAELAKRSGLSVETLYKVRAGKRQPGQKTIEGLMQAFPSLSYRDLFMPSDRTVVHRSRTSVQIARQRTGACGGMSFALRSLVLTTRGARALLLDSLGISLPASYAAWGAPDSPRDANGHPRQRGRATCSQCTRIERREPAA